MDEGRNSFTTGTWNGEQIDRYIMNELLAEDTRSTQKGEAERKVTENKKRMEGGHDDDYIHECQRLWVLLVKRLQI